jgi:hypothetical protein
VRELAQITLDAALLAQRAEGERPPDGRAWERAVGHLLRRPGMRIVQQAGLQTLFGLRSASGARHELDGAAAGVDRAYLIEAKATPAIGKADVACFEMKITDFYFACWRMVSMASWKPIFVCAAAVNDSMRRLCAARSMILCDPQRLPLPVLYHHAIHPHSATQLPDTLSDELLRLAPRALGSLQQRYVPDLDADELRLRPSPYTPDEIDDLLWLQDELTDEVLDRYDRVAPGALERRAARLHRAFLARRAG